MQTGAAPLHSAASGGHLKIVEMLLEANADVNDKTKVSSYLCSA